VTTLPRVPALLVEPPEPPGRAVVRAFFGEPDDDAEAVTGLARPALPAVACDHAALVAVYPALAPRVTRFVGDMLGDRALASDATQETFVRAFRRVADLPRSTRLVPWVFGVARHVALEMRKARVRVRRVIDDAAAVDERTRDARGRSPEDILLDREALAVVQRALECLGEERRAVLLLRLDHGLAYDEIAQVMGWSLAKVRVEIFRAREVLRATFDEYRGGAT
jgi:RNA polymerase sigma-70 factor (ECF subfamily)